MFTIVTGRQPAYFSLGILKLNLISNKYCAPYRTLHADLTVNVKFTFQFYVFFKSLKDKRSRIRRSIYLKRTLNLNPLRKSFTPFSRAGRSAARAGGVGVHGAAARGAGRGGARAVRGGVAPAHGRRARRAGRAARGARRAARLPGAARAARPGAAPAPPPGRAHSGTRECSIPADPERSIGMLRFEAVICDFLQDAISFLGHVGGVDRSLTLSLWDCPFVSRPDKPRWRSRNKGANPTCLGLSFY